MPHGTRSCYQRGCRCLPCKAAEAAYRSQLRRQQTRARRPLGALIPASEAWARIRVLTQEGFSQRRMSRELGSAHGHAPVRAFTPATRIRLLTLLRLRAACARYLIPDTDLPNHQPYPDATPSPPPE